MVEGVGALLLPLCFVQEPGFLQGQRCLVGKGGQEGDFVFRPLVYSLVKYDQNSDRLIVDQEGNVDSSVETRTLKVLAGRFRRQQRVILDILSQMGFFSRQDTAHDARTVLGDVGLFYLGGHGQMSGCGVRGSPRDQPVSFQQSQRGRRRANQADSLVDDQVQHFVRVVGRNHLVGDLLKRDGAFPLTLQVFQ